MERIPIHITALLAMTTLAACDFLDIDTPGIVNRDKMFENEQGFIDAMNGVYASMADADLYGEQLSFGFVDEIAQLYYNDYEANETTLTKTFDLRYRDEDVRPQIDAIWSKAYNTIASANSVLDNISGHDFAILPRIRGEALTVRAFLHFDLLRLFAPNIERGDEQAIPYVEHFSISPVERSTVREVYERIVADLTEAYGLLRDAQPASGRTPQTNSANRKSPACTVRNLTKTATSSRAAASRLSTKTFIRPARNPAFTSGATGFTLRPPTPTKPRAAKSIRHTLTFSA